MVQILLNISLFLCSCLWFSITCLSPFLWSTQGSQGSVCGLILFNMYTTPLSTLISSRSLNHLYADATQIFISFVPKTFTTAITQLQDTISDISSWMIANLLSLNPSKQNFCSLVFLNKYLNSPTGISPFLQITLYHLKILFVTLVSSLINVSLFLNRFHLYPVRAAITSATFASSDILSTSKQHPLSLLLLYILY